MRRCDFLKKSAAAGGATIYSLLPDAPAHAARPAPDASAWVVTPQVPGRVQPFDLADVRLLPGPFQQARDRDSADLLALEPDRLLHSFRTEAGLPAKAPAYGGWEQTSLAGHSPAACSAAASCAEANEVSPLTSASPPCYDSRTNP